MSIPISQFIPLPPLPLLGFNFLSVMEVSKYKNEKVRKTDIILALSELIQ